MFALRTTPRRARTVDREGDEMSEGPAYTTRFGSLDDYEKGGVDVIDDDPKHYAFSNCFA